MGRYPIFTSGLGMFSVRSPNRVPKPPQNSTTFIGVCPGSSESKVRGTRSRAGPLQLVVQQTLLAKSYKDLEPHVLGASEIGVVESHCLQPRLQLADGGEQVDLGLMAGRQLPVQPKIHAVGTAVLRCVLVDRYAYARNDLCDGFRKILHLIVPCVTAHVDGQECPRRRIPGDGPVERPCHVPDVDQRPPWRPVAQDRNLLGTDRTCDKVIDDQRSE